MKQTLPMASLVAMALCGCRDDYAAEVAKTEIKNVHIQAYSNKYVDVDVFTYDNCQYLIASGSGKVSLIHKQNCTNHVTMER